MAEARAGDGAPVRVPIPVFGSWADAVAALNATAVAAVVHRRTYLDGPRG